jgi:undecaprenol kinase
MLKKIINRLAYALNGLWHATTKDSGFRSHLYLGGVITIGIIVFLFPLSTIEFLFVIMAYLLVLITELQNSALEAALDKLHPELHDNIKVSKDMAAAAVLTAGGFLLIVLLVITLERVGLVW